MYNEMKSFLFMCKYFLIFHTKSNNKFHIKRIVIIQIKINLIANTN